MAIPASVSKFLEERGHTFVVTSDKDGENSVFERELPDADVVISQPFWPAYLTAERIAKAKKLKLVVTAGVQKMAPGLKVAFPGAASNLEPKQAAR